MTYIDKHVELSPTSLYEAVSGPIKLTASETALGIYVIPAGAWWLYVTANMKCTSIGAGHYTQAHLMLRAPTSDAAVRESPCYQRAYFAAEPMACQLYVRSMEPMPITVSAWRLDDYPGEMLNLKFTGIQDPFPQ